MNRFFAVLLFSLGLATVPAGAADTSAMPSSEPIFAATLADMSGEPLPLSTLKGRVTVLNFWATWCTPCRNEIPHLIESYETYSPRGVIFLGAAVEDGTEAVQTFAKSYGMNFPLAIAGRERGIALLQALGNRIAGLPYTVVLDRHGNVVAVRRGVMTSDRLRQILDPLL